MPERAFIASASKTEVRPRNNILRSAKFSETFLSGFLRFVLVKTIYPNSIELRRVKRAGISAEVAINAKANLCFPPHRQKQTDTNKDRKRAHRIALCSLRVIARFSPNFGFGQSFGAKTGKGSQPNPNARLCKRRR